MNPDQALALLRQLINSPVVKLTLGINELGACALAVDTLADALKPKPEPPPAPAPAPSPPSESQPI